MPSDVSLLLFVGLPATVDHGISIPLVRTAASSFQIFARPSAGINCGSFSHLIRTGTSSLQFFAGHSAGVNCGSFTGDGKLVVTGCEDAKLRVFDPKVRTESAL